MTQRVPADLLREMVREILHEVVEEEVTSRVDPATDRLVDAGRWRETIAIGTQDDLNRAVRRILADAIDPSRRAAIERGDVTFLLGGAVASRPGPAGAGESLQRVEKGAVTEKHVRTAAEAGAVIVAARRVVITPLAKDKARSLGVVIRRET